MRNNLLSGYLRLSTSAQALLLGSLLIGSSPASAATTEVRFLDNCTGEPLTLGTPNGVRLEVEIKDLGEKKENREPILLDLTLSAIEPGIDSIRSITLLKKKKYWPKNGHILIQQKLDLKKARIIQAQALWTQNNQLGENVGTLLMPGTSFEPFYKRVSESYCSWESSSHLESGHYFNSSTSKMSLKKSFEWSQMRGGQQGRTAGPPAITGDGPFRFGTTLRPEPLIGGTPLGGIALWLFHGRDSIQSQEESATVEREWLLEPSQGGFLASRWLFNRYRAEEYVLRRSSTTRSCWQWTIARRGYLDVGAPKIDFYVVSESDATDLKKAVEAIENIEPILNTCTSPLEKGESEQTKFISPTGITEQELLYFNADEERKE